MSVQMTQRLEIRKIDELIPYANNARVHSPAQIEQLRRSLREFGFVSPVLIDSAGNVIAGHGRIQAAKLEGIQEAPCVLVEHLTDAQRRAYILADNRLAETAGWDQALVSEELLALRDAGMDLSLTGFSEGDVLLTSTDEVIEDDCDLTPPETPATQPGQLWQLGRHRLLCGDATSPPPRCRCAWAKDSWRIFCRPILRMASVIQVPPARSPTTTKQARICTSFYWQLFWLRCRCSHLEPPGTVGPHPALTSSNSPPQQERQKFRSGRSSSG